MGSDKGASISVRAVRDTAYAFGAKLTVGLTAAFFGAWLNRVVPSSELALWPITLALGGFLSSMASCGIGDALVRDVPALIATRRRAEASGLLRTGLLINCASCLLFALLIYWKADLVAHLVIRDGGAVGLVRLMMLGALLTALEGRVLWAVNAVQEFRRRAAMTLFTGLARTPLLIASFLLGGTHGLIAGITLLALAGLVWNLAIIWPHLWTPGPLARPQTLLARSIPFWGTSLASIAGGQANYLLISAFAGPEMLAAYFVADSAVAYLRSLGKVAVQAVAPKLAEAAAGDPTKAARVFTRCTRYLSLGIYPIYITGAIVGPLMMKVYGGAQYADAGIVATVLCLSLLGETLNRLHYSALRAFASPWLTFVSSLFRPLANAVPLILLAPLMGSTGAAIAAAVKFAALALISGWFLTRSITVKYDWLALQKALQATAIGGLAALACYIVWGPQAWVLAPAALICGLGYTVGLARQLDVADMLLIEEVLPRRLLDARWPQALLRVLRTLWTRPSQREGLAGPDEESAATTPSPPRVPQDSADGTQPR